MANSRIIHPKDHTSLLSSYLAHVEGSQLTTKFSLSIVFHTIAFQRGMTKIWQKRKAQKKSNRKKEAEDELQFIVSNGRSPIRSVIIRVIREFKIYDATVAKTSL